MLLIANPQPTNLYSKYKFPTNSFRKVSFELAPQISFTSDCMDLILAALFNTRCRHTICLFEMTGNLNNSSNC